MARCWIAEGRSKPEKSASRGKLSSYRMRRRLVEARVSDPCCQNCRLPRNESVDSWQGKTYFIPVGVDFLTLEVGETSIFSHDCKNSVIRQFDDDVELTCSLSKKDLMVWFFEKNMKKKFATGKIFLPTS